MEPVCIFLFAPTRPLPPASEAACLQRLSALTTAAKGPSLLLCLGPAAGNLADRARQLETPVVADAREAAPPPENAPWPCGASEALAQARKRFPGTGCVFADLLRPDLDADLLRNFLAATSLAPDTPLASLHPIRDHPCQLIHYFTLRDMLALARSPDVSTPPASGPLAVGHGENGLQWRWDRTDAGRSLLSWTPPGWPEASGLAPDVLLHAETLDAAGNSLGRVMVRRPEPGRPLDLGPLPRTARRLLLCLLTSGSGDYHFQAASPGIKGFWRVCDNGDIILEGTGRLLSGRQDFPDLFLTDGMLAYLPPGLPTPGLEGLRGFLLDQEPRPRQDDASALAQLPPPAQPQGPRP